MTIAFFFFASCSPTPPLVLEEEFKIEILSFSEEQREVEIISNESLDLNHYILRQGETKTIYSLAGVSL